MSFFFFFKFYQLLCILPLATGESCSIFLGSSSVHRHCRTGAATWFIFPVCSFCSKSQQQVLRHSVPAPETISNTEVISGTPLSFLIKLQKYIYNFPFLPLLWSINRVDIQAETRRMILTHLQGKQSFELSWPFDASSIFWTYSFFKEKGLLGSDPGIFSDLQRSGKSRTHPGLIQEVNLKIRLEKIQYIMVRWVNLDKTRYIFINKRCDWGSPVSWGSAPCTCALWCLNNTWVHVVALIPGILVVSLSSIHPLLY